MGSGKSSTGRVLSRRLGYRFIDMDAEIEAREGMSIVRIFAEKGESYFRRVESELLEELMHQQKVVVSCGGGVVELNHNRETLKKGFYVVYLEVDFETAWKRIRSSSSRPKASGGKAATLALFEKRKPVYTGIADVRINAAERSPSLLADIIIRELKKYAGN